MINDQGLTSIAPYKCFGLRDTLRRRTSLVANGTKRKCKWLPRAIVAARDPEQTSALSL